jgi:hypothetical protein
MVSGEALSTRLFTEVTASESACHSSTSQTSMQRRSCYSCLFLLGYDTDLNIESNPLRHVLSELVVSRGTARRTTANISFPKFPRTSTAALAQHPKLVHPAQSRPFEHQLLSLPKDSLFSCS